MNSMTRDTEATKKTIRLSARPARWLPLWGPCSRVADVGTDHGYIPSIWCSRRLQSALAMDVRRAPGAPGPTSDRWRRVPGTDRHAPVRARLSALAGEADTVVIAGMGGELIIRILDEGRHMWDSVESWVLSPSRSCRRSGIFFRDRAFLLRRTIVKDEGNTIP